MKHLNSPVRFACTLAFLPICCFAAQAQTRTFVSGLGSDTNPCTRISPCRSFQRAHDVVVAGGEVIAIDSAGYGPITITKSVSIIGDGVYAGINTSSGNGVTIATAGITVNLRSLLIAGLGTATNGISVTSVGKLHVEECVISGFAGLGIDVSLTADNSYIFLKDTIARDNAIHGIRITTSTGTVRASIDNCRSENNGNYGFIAFSNSRVTIKRSIASHNAATGFQVFAEAGTTAELNCEECVSSNNTVGFMTGAPAGGAATIRVSNSTATNNTGLGFWQDGTGVFESRVNNTVAGNNNGGAQTSGMITPITGQ
jgi:hypothetical protein